MMRAMRTGMGIAGAGARRRGFEQVKVDEGADVRLAGVAGEAAEGGQGHLDSMMGWACGVTVRVTGAGARCSVVIIGARGL